MRTTDAVVGKWGEVFEAYGLPPITHKKHYNGNSPCCNRKGKFRIDDKEGKGTFICACGAAGDGWKLLKISTGKEFGVLAREVDKIIGNTPDIKPKPITKKNPNNHMHLIKNGNPIKGSVIEKYFKSRGIFELPTRAAWELNGNLFCIAVDERLAPVYTHTTYFENGEKKSRKLKSIQEHESYGVIRLFDPQETIGIAEGIETALSCKQIYKVNTWSAMNAVNIKKFIAPNGINKLIIFADNDKNGTGLAAAFECANRNILNRNNDVKQVKIRWPSKVNDFNDLLVEGSEVHEWCLEG